MLHLVNGYVYSTPEAFVMGRPVQLSAPSHEILDPEYVFPRETWNCWHVALYAGDMGKLFTFAEFDLPYAAFQKRNKLRFYAINQIRAAIHDRALFQSSRV